MGCGASQQPPQSSAAVVPAPSSPNHQTQDEADAPVKTQAPSEGVAHVALDQAEAAPVTTQAPSAVEGVQNFDPLKAAVERNAQYVKEHKLVMASRQDEQSQVFKIEAAFRSLDKDHSGFLDESEISQGLQNAGIDPPADMAAFMTEVDTNSDGKVDLTEFIRVAGKLLDPGMGNALKSHANHRRWMEMIAKSSGIPHVPTVEGEADGEVKEADRQNVADLMNSRSWDNLYDLFDDNVKAAFPKDQYLQAMNHWVQSNTVISLPGGDEGYWFNYLLTTETVVSVSRQKLAFMLVNGKIIGINPEAQAESTPIQDPLSVKYGVYFDTRNATPHHNKWHAKIGAEDEYLVVWPKPSAPHQKFELFSFYLERDGHKIELEMLDLTEESGEVQPPHNHVHVAKAVGPGTIIIELKYVHLPRRVEVYNEATPQKYFVEDSQPLEGKYKPQLMPHGAKWQEFCSKGDLTWHRDTENIIMFAQRAWKHIASNHRYDNSAETSARMTLDDIVEGGLSHCVQRSIMFNTVMTANGIDSRYNVTNAHTFPNILIPGCGWVPMEPTGDIWDMCDNCDCNDHVIYIGSVPQLTWNTLGIQDQLLAEAKNKLMRCFNEKDDLEGEIGDALMAYWPTSYEQFKNFGDVTFVKEGVFKQTLGPDILPAWMGVTPPPVVYLVCTFANHGGKQFCFQLWLDGGKIIGMMLVSPEEFDKKEDESQADPKPAAKGFGGNNPHLINLKLGKGNKPAKFYWEDVLASPGKVQLSPIEAWSNQFGYKYE
eukprot:s741_g7.t1